LLLETKKAGLGSRDLLGTTECLVGSLLNVLKHKGMGRLLLRTKFVVFPLKTFDLRDLETKNIAIHVGANTLSATLRTTSVRNAAETAILTTGTGRH